MFNMKQHYCVYFIHTYTLVNLQWLLKGPQANNTKRYTHLNFLNILWAVVCK